MDAHRPIPSLARLPRRAWALLAVLVALLAPPGCRDALDGDSVDDRPPTVVVSIPPLAGLVRPVLPEDCEIRVLVPAGRSAHGYQPTAEDISAVARADAVILVGMNLESSMPRGIRMVPSVRMADVLGIVGEGCDHFDDHAHHHAHGHDHADGSGDPHLWLDPVLAAQFVRTLPGALPESLTDDRTAERAEALAEQIDRVDSDYRSRLLPYRGRAIVTHHASFNRVAERYGLEVAAVLRAIETLEPSPADIAKAVDAIEQRGVGAIFVEPQFGVSSATRVAEAAGVELVTLDPLGKGDWFAMMRTNLDALVEGLSAGGEGVPASRAAPVDGSPLP